MCFSATGSFVSAAINAAAGTVVLRRTAGTPEGILAAFPLTFAVQQTMEGFLWLDLAREGGGPSNSTLATGFVSVALVLWPLLSPFAAFVLEQNRLRKMLLAGLIALGALYAMYYAYFIAQYPFSAQIVGHTLVYSNGLGFPLASAVLYCALTCIPLLVSTQGSLKLLGLCVLIGLTVSYGLFFFSFLSVWCFFAAIASGLVFFRAYFELPRSALHQA